MKKKVLPFTIPIVSCYPSTSQAAGILFSDENLYEWMFNNFIQIFEVENNRAIDYYDFAIENNPFLSYNEIDYSFIYSNWDSIIEFIKKAIDDDYYIRIFVNMSKIKAYKSELDIQHDIMIYGYDNSNEQFYIADHFNNGYFATSMCSYNEIKKAADTYDKKLFDANPAFLNCIQLIKKEKSLMRLRFSMYTYEQMVSFTTLNMNRIIMSLEDYINGVPTRGWYTRGKVMDEKITLGHRWGINCYDVIIESLYDIIENNAEYGFLQQSIYLLYNHKRVMIERIKILINRFNIKNGCLYIVQYGELKKKIYCSLLNYTKALLTNREKENFKSIAENLKEIKKSDYECTKSLIDSLCCVSINP